MLNVIRGLIVIIQFYHYHTWAPRRSDRRALAVDTIERDAEEIEWGWLPLKAGDEIVLDEDQPNKEDGWLFGTRVADGKHGEFPEYSVKVQVDDNSSAKCMEIKKKFSVRFGFHNNTFDKIISPQIQGTRKAYPHLPSVFKVGNFMEYFTICGDRGGKNIKALQDNDIRVPLFANVVSKTAPSEAEQKKIEKYNDGALNNIWGIIARLNNEQIYQDIQKERNRPVEPGGTQDALIGDGDDSYYRDHIMEGLGWRTWR